MTEPMNIVIPMAGRGSRFAVAGYTDPKPLIEVHGVPMIEVVVNNVRPQRPHRFIFLVLAEHLERFGVERLLRRIAPGCEIVPVAGVTEGAACTVLLAEELINDDTPLMTANSDQWVDVSIDDYLAAFDDTSAAGMIMTMAADDPKWSFLRLDEAGRVTEVLEKQAVSSEATVGIYNFRHGRDFVWAAREAIARDLRVNGEFYVAPVYNHLIERGEEIAYYNVGTDVEGMHGLGIPSDLLAFCEKPVSRRATAVGGA